MTASDPAVRIRPEERVEGDLTAGMVREQAIAIDGMWSGLVRTEAHMTSGWHHHGDYDTSIYVLTGALRMECGPAGAVGSRQRRATSSMYRGVPFTVRAIPRRWKVT